MRNNEIEKIVKELKRVEGSNVWIYIGNKLYGDQNVKCALQVINDEERLGFYIGEQEIYIEKKRICNIVAGDNLYYFADELMCIKIRRL